MVSSWSRQCLDAMCFATRYRRTGSSGRCSSVVSCDPAPDLHFARPTDGEAIYGNEGGAGRPDRRSTMEPFEFSLQKATEGYPRAFVKGFGPSCQQHHDRRAFERNLLSYRCCCPSNGLDPHRAALASRWRSTATNNRSSGWPCSVVDRSAYRDKIAALPSSGDEADVDGSADDDGVR